MIDLLFSEQVKAAGRLDWNPGLASLSLWWTAQGLPCRLDIGAPGQQARTPEFRVYPDNREIPESIQEVRRQIDSYLAGELRSFHLTLCLQGSPFQRRAWQALARVPWGESRTYGELARELGQPGASRALGSAMGANPLPIILPCHRILAASGRLGGYSGGLEIKRLLLELEGTDFRE